MKKILLKIAAFIVTFIVSAMIISALMNRDVVDEIVKMGDATFPTVAVVHDNKEINLMHGYGGEMEKNFIRDSLTPLEKDRSVNIAVHTYGSDISSISYEVRSADAKRLVENSELSEFEPDGDEIRAKFQVKDLIENDREYILGITLKERSGREIYYATRIIYNQNFRESELLEFVSKFSALTFDKENAKPIVSYLESNSSGDNSNFAHVNIHSSFDQITWGLLGVKAPDKVYTKILEMDDSTAAIQLTYRVNIPENEKQVEYNAKEYYRVRYTNKRIYLLDFERDMEQLFNASDTSLFNSDKIYLGITDNYVNMQESTDGSMVAFVQNGALYAFRSVDSRIIRVFSFADDKNPDERNDFNEHDIKILSVDETGNIQFMVYGYMNRGRHEGEVGVSVYYFNSATNRMEEQIYIPYTRSYEILKSDVSRLAYTGGGNELSLYMDGSIYRIDLGGNSAETVAEGLDRDSMVVSDNNRIAAWQSEDKKTIHYLNLSNKSKREITKGENNALTPLGFVGEDFVYGVASTSNYIKNSSGITLRPMSTICIEDSEGNLVKTYAQNDIYITRAEVNSSEVVLKRIRMVAGSGTYSTVSDDEIVNNLPEETSKNKIISVAIDRYESVAEISLAQKIKSAVHVVNPEEVMSGDNSLSIPVKEMDNAYYVYAKGHIYGIYSTVYEAVGVADGEDGVVIDGEQDYIWKKGNRKTETQIRNIAAVEASGKTTVAAALEALMKNAGVIVDAQHLIDNGENAMGIIADRIENSKPLNLAGCSLQSVLYYVSQGIPVMATIDENQTVLIVGYDAKNTVIMDPTTGTIYKKGMNDSKSWFETHGNEFVSYVISEK